MLGVLCVTGTTVLLQLGFQQAAAPSGMKLPVGEWSGEGQYAYEVWPKEAGAGAEPPISAASRYPTRLSIRADKLDGHDVLIFDIVSRHKDVGVLKDDVHAVVAFEEAKRLSESTLLYRLVDIELNSNEGQPLHYQIEVPPASASLIHAGDDLLFLTQHGENFNETYRFIGGAKGTVTEVQKFGFASPGSDENEAGFIHWVETLKRK